MGTKIKLPDSIVTPKDTLQLVNEIRAYTAWFNKELIKKKVNASHTAVSPPPPLSPSTKELLRTHKEQGQLDRRGLEQLIFDIEQLRRQAPTITVTLAGPAPEELRSTIVEWCRKNIQADIFVAFQFDATILGGIVVRAGSRLFDWSFRSKLMEPTVRFTEVLRRA